MIVSGRLARGANHGRLAATMRQAFLGGVASLLMSGSALAVPADLYFSEYVEGSRFNKALELFNPSGAAIDLSAYTIEAFHNGRAEGLGPSFSIPLSGTLAPNGSYVISNPSASASVLAVSNATDAGIQFNGDDFLRLVRSGTTIDAIGQVGFDPGSQWGAGLISTADNTLRRNAAIVSAYTSVNSAYDPAVASSAGSSNDWVGFASDTFDGLGCGGVGACVVVTPSAATIMEIQGPGHLSPLAGNLVQTSGVITAIAPNGFYIQDPTGDGNVNTSDGIFVFTGSAPGGVAVGDQVQLDGTVNEFFNETQITLSNVSVTAPAGVAPTIAPLVISTSATADRQMPNRIIDDNNGDNFNPATDGRDFYESLEGMLVMLPNPLAVSDEDTRATFGEIYVVSKDGNPTGLNARGGITITGDPGASVEENPNRADLNPERILLVGTVGNDTRPAIIPEMGDIVASTDTNGDGTPDAITGVVQFNFNDYRLRPLDEVITTKTAPAPESAALASGPNLLTVATFNVLNLDPGDATINDPRDPTSPRDRIAQIAQQIVGNLNAPDLVALQEIQDGSGEANDGTVSAAATLQALVDAISAAGGPAYAFKDNVFIGDNVNGGAPGGNIRTAFIYQPDRVNVDDLSLSTLDKDGNRIFDPLLIGDTQTDPTSTFFDTRLPLMMEFDFNGETVLVINNHFPSKTGSDPLFGATQPAANGAVDDRNEMAALINSYLDGLLAADPNANVIVLGDFNEFQFYDPLMILAGLVDPNNPSIGTPGDQILWNLALLGIDPLDVFTFEFEGNSQALDHILLSAGALALFAGVDYVHMNTGRLFETLISDHDPILAQFRIPLQVSDVPEPAMMPVIVLCLAGIAAIRRRRHG